MIRRLSLLRVARLVAIWGLISLIGAFATAAPVPYWWDVGAGTGGPGSWLTDPYWVISSGPGTVWAPDPTNGIDVKFTNAPAAVITLGGTASTVNSMTFGAGYTIAGPGQINLGNYDSAGGTITVDPNQTATIGTILGGGVGLTKEGSGTLSLTNTNNVYTGATNINAGVLAVGSGNPLATSAVTVGANGILQLTGATSSGLLAQYYNFTATMPTFNGATYASLAQVNGVLAGGTYVGSSVFNSFPMFDFPAAGYPAVGNLTYSVEKWTGSFVAPVAGNYTFWSGVDDYNRFWLDGADTSLIATNGTVTVSLSAGAHPIVIVSQNVGGPGNIWMDVQGPAGSGAFYRQRIPYTLLSNGVATTIGSLSGSGALDLGTATLDTGSDGTSTSFSGIITGTGGLIKSGSGTLALFGTNPFNGATTINAGAIRLDSPLALQFSGITVTPTNGLKFGAGNTAPTVGGLSGAGNVDLTTTGSDPVTLTISGAGNYSGVLSGGSGIVKAGFGTQTFFTAQKYDGSTTVNGGTLVPGLNDALPSGTALTVSGPTAVLNMATFTNTVAGFTLDNLGTIAGSAVASVGTGTLTLSSGNFELKSGYVGVVLAGANRGVNKTTSGYVTFNAAATATYTGATNISAGGIILGANNVLSNGSAINITTAGAVLDMAAYTSLTGTVTVDNRRTALGHRGRPVDRQLRQHVRSQEGLR